MKRRVGILKAAWADLLDNRRQDRIGFLQVVDRFAVADRRGQCHSSPGLEKIEQKDSHARKNGGSLSHRRT
jgi:hypothetical protein